MANWYGTARSNYVRIKDMDGLRKALAPFPITIEEQDDKVCFLSEEQDSGGWPSWAYLEDEDDSKREVEFDATSCICPYMQEGEVLVMMEAGAEKMCYVSGSAVAFNHNGDYVAIYLTDIYQKAADAFGVDRAAITEAEY